MGHPRPELHLGARTWSEIAQWARPPVIALPVGSTEQHGPHLPLSTDTVIAEALAANLVAHLAPSPGQEPASWPCLIGPTLEVTASGEHAGFAGTLSIGVSATTETLIELGRSADWSGGLLLINGHGGNHHSVITAVETLQREGRRVYAWWPRIPGGDLHAGHSETSLMLHLRPDLVDLECAVAGPTVDLDSLRNHGVLPLSPTGVLGDPTTASPAHGARIWAELCQELRRSYHRWFTEAAP